MDVDEEEDSFYKPLPSSTPITKTEPKPEPKPITKEPEQDPDSDDSFDNFDPFSQALTQTQKPTPKPTVLPIKNKNGSFTRHGSDNSFFNPPKKPIKLTPPPTTITSFHQMSQISVLARPATPNGEMLMLRSQLDQARREKDKLNDKWQKRLKEVTDNHNALSEAQAKRISQLEKEKEVREIGNSCRRIEATSPNTSSSNIRKVFPTTSRSILKKPGAEKNALTPRRSVQIHQQHPLSAFRHENVPVFRAENEADDETFPLEESFQPRATSTPRAPTIVRNCINLRRAHEPRENEAEPPCKRKHAEVSRKSRTREELMKMRRQLRSKFAEKSPEKELEPEHKTPTYLETQLELLRISKNPENLEKKAKIREICASFQKAKPPQKCEKCRIFEARNVENLEQNVKKEWVIRETQRCEKKENEAEIPLFLMYSSTIQNVARKGISNLEKTKAERIKSEEEFKKKCEQIRQIRNLEDIQEEKREFWRSKIMTELNENGEMEAEVNRIMDFERDQDDENDDYIWTSSDSENDAEILKICENCQNRQKLNRRLQRRQIEKFKLKIECFEDFGKEQREILRNQSILTKSKIEAADMVLNQQIDEIFGGKLLENKEEEDF